LRALLRLAQVPSWRFAKLSEAFAESIGKRAPERRFCRQPEKL
jgi:hypothetical protein